MPVTLGPHDVHVRYRLIDGFGEDDCTRAMDILSGEERARAARFVFARDRLMFVAAHAMLRQALSGYEGVRPDAWTFDQVANGKPVLGARHQGIDLTFNLAHTHGVVACAIARGVDVGVDVEAVTSRVHALDIATRFFAPAEVEALRACEAERRDVRFIEIWTLKESYIKALGEGLSHPLATFAFAFDEAASCRFAAAAPADRDAWHFELFAPTSAHRMAVAVRRGGTAHAITAWDDGDRERRPIHALRRSDGADRIARR
jgi:4'-phosphopantetheinyl transferase